MEPTRLIVFGGIIAFAFVICLIVLLAMRSRRWLERLLGQGALNFTRIMRPSPEWDQLRKFLAEHLEHRGTDFTIKVAYRRTNTQDFLYTVTVPSSSGTPTASAANSAGSFSEYFVRMPTSVNVPFTIRRGVLAGSAGRFMFSMLKSMGVPLQMLEEGLSEEFQEHFSVLYIRGEEGPPEVPSELQRTLVRHARDSEMGYSIKQLMGGDGFLSIGDTGILLRLSSSKHPKDIDHIRTLTRIMDDIKRHVA